MRTEKKTALFDPVYWAIGTLILGLFFMIMGYFAFPKDKNFAWKISSAFLLLFSIFTNIFNIPAEDYATIVRKGIVAFAGLVLSFKYLAEFFSGQAIRDVPSYRTIYFIIILGYLSILTLCVFVRFILQKIKERDKKEHGV